MSPGSKQILTLSLPDGSPITSKKSRIRPKTGKKNKFMLQHENDNSLLINTENVSKSGSKRGTSHFKDKTQSLSPLQKIISNDFTPGDKNQEFGIKTQFCDDMLSSVKKVDKYEKSVDLLDSASNASSIRKNAKMIGLSPRRESSSKNLLLQVIKQPANRHQSARPHVKPL